MGLFDRFKSMLSPVSKDDPFFGPVRFQKAGFWEADMHFAPEDGRVEIVIAGGKNHPTEAQRRFYRELEQRYPQLKQEAGEYLLEQLRNWREDFEPDDVWTQFRLESFSLPDPDAGAQEWELVYELHDDGHLFCVMMNRWQVEGIRIDG